MNKYYIIISQEIKNRINIRLKMGINNNKSERNE